MSALVLDIGSSTIRAGYAGDDTPKAIIPTSYGYIEEASENQDTPMETDGETEAKGQNGEPTSADQKKVKLYIGQNGPSLFRPNMEIRNPMKAGLSTYIPIRIVSLFTLNLSLVNDFTPITPLIRNVLEEGLRCNPSEHPILVTEPAWNTPANRERMAEIMFEEFQVPAFYIANTGVLDA